LLSNTRMMDPRKERLFRDVVVGLDRAGHRQCMLHGSNGYSERYEIGKDVDIVSEDPAQIPLILAEDGAASVARVGEESENTVYTLYRHERGGPVFLQLDACAACRFLGYAFLGGEELLEDRAPYDYFYVLSPEHEFICYLLRRLIKGLDRTRAQRLSELYAEDPAGCHVQLARFFPESDAALIEDAARSGDWELALSQAERLRKVVSERAGQPLGNARDLLHKIGARARAYVRPEGLMVAFLGTDGVGKSTVTSRIERDLAPAFSSTERYHRPVETVLWRMRQRIKRYRARSSAVEPVDASAPGTAAQATSSEAPPRGLPASILKLGLWWADYTVLGYLLTIYPRLARSTLVLFDRYYEDLLVYPRSYRYGGPLWLARFVGRLIPRPHLVFLLDAPPEVIQARKQELTFEQTAYEREAYLNVVQGLPNAHVVDASKPIDAVVNEIEGVILDHMADRTATNLERDRRPKSIRRLRMVKQHLMRGNRLRWMRS
jgi:thymidylate kinase